MTPNDIEILIHYYVSPTVHPRFDAPAVRESVNWFVTEGLLEASEVRDGRYATTERGRALIEMLCSTPFPERAWIDPRSRTIVERA